MRTQETEIYVSAQAQGEDVPRVRRQASPTPVHLLLRRVHREAHREGRLCPHQGQEGLLSFENCGLF